MTTPTPQPNTEPNDTLSSQVNLLLQREKELTATQIRLEHAMARNVSLQQMSQFLITSQSLEQGLAHTTKALVTQMSFEKSLVVLGDEQGLRVASTCGYSRDEQARLAKGDVAKLGSISQEINAMGTGVFVNTDEERTQLGGEALEWIGMYTLLAAPLLEGDKVVGFLAAGYSEANANAYRETLLLGDRDAVWFSALANQVSAMAINAKLITSLRERTTELHAEQARLHASIDSLSLGFVLVDTQGNLVLKNQALGAIVAGSVGTLADLTRAVPQVDLAEGIARVQRERSKLNIKAADVGARILRILLAPVTEAEVVLGVVILFEDITEEKLLDRSKDEFFSIASHELRTPLTAIKGNSSMILNYYRDSIKEPSLREMMEDIHDASGRLIEIVNDFLDVSRIEQGKMTYRKEAFDMAEVVEGVFYEVGAVVKQKGLYLTMAEEAKTLEALPKVFGDKNRTKQIFYNLIGNAMKFTEKGGITVHVAPEEGMLKVTVSDTGRGIPVEAQKLLFRKFQQAGESLLTRDTTRGTGLGLYISKLMAEGMGGRLVLEHSEVGQGTTFSLAIPLAR